MLDLEICRKCCELSDMVRWHTCKEDVIRDIERRNYVVCPGSDSFKALKAYLDQLPPEWCRFKFEQSVAVCVNIDKIAGDV